MTLPPILYSPFEIAVRVFSEVFWSPAEDKHRCPAQLRLPGSCLDYGVVLGRVRHPDYDPIDLRRGLVGGRTYYRDRTARLFGDLCCRRTQQRAGVAPDPDRAKANQLGVAR